MKPHKITIKDRIESFGLKLAEWIVCFFMLLGLQVVMLIPILNVYIFFKLNDEQFDLQWEISELKSKLKKYEPEEKKEDGLFHGYQPEVTKKEEN